jgi:hypothetical protein
MPDAQFKTTEHVDPANRLDGLTWEYPEQHIGDDIATTPNGGLVRDGDRVLHGVKANNYRLPEDRNVEGKYPGDVFRLKGLNSAEGQAVAGYEMELPTYDKSGKPFRLWNEEGQPISDKLAKMIGEHPELWVHTAEIETADPHSTSTEAATELYLAVRNLFDALPEGVMLDPISAWMDRKPTTEDTTPKPYVGVMIEALGEHILNFVGHGIHEHYDVDPEHILFVAQYLQMLAPYLNAGLQSAPYMHGDLDPRLSEIFETHSDVELLREIEKESNSPAWASVRYATRYFGSSAGGVRPNAHSSRDEFMRFADRKLRDGEVNNVSRADGPHGDVRQRFDLAPGRVELCVKDNPMGNIQVLKAYMDLTWGVINSLVEVSQMGDEGRNKLHSAFADLFGDKEDPSDMATVYERVHRNSLVIAKNGPHTTVQDSKGNRVDVRHQVERVMDFVKTYKGAIPEESAQIIRATLGDPRELKIGSTPADYYRTNYATPADYIKLAVQTYIEAGMTPESALMQAKIDRMNAFSAYILSAS